MTVVFQCACGAELSVPDQLAGRQARCPQCHAVNHVPEERRAMASARPPVSVGTVLTSVRTAPLPSQDPVDARATVGPESAAQASGVAPLGPAYPALTWLCLGYAVVLFLVGLALAVLGIVWLIDPARVLHGLVSLFLAVVVFGLMLLLMLAGLLLRDWGKERHRQP